MTIFLASQLLASLAFLAGIAAFQLRIRRNVLLLWSLSALLNATHFYLLQAPEIALLLLITASRFFTAAFTTRKSPMFVFLGLATFAYLSVPYQDSGYLALLATLLGTYGSFRRHDLQVRLYMMATSVLWIIHNLLVWTPVAAGMEAFFLSSNLLALWRFYSHHR